MNLARNRTFWLPDVLNRYIRAFTIPGQRGRLDRGVWRLAKHASSTTFFESNRWSCRLSVEPSKRTSGRETHLAATGTVALPQNPGKSKETTFSSDAGYTIIDGFTLIEIMISISVGAIILTAAALCLNAAITSQRMIDPRVDTLQTARVALALISADLRGACPLDKSYAFLGSHRMVGKTVSDNIDFATHNYAPKHPREGDFCETSYFLDKTSANGKLALFRRRNPLIAQDSISGGKREEIAPNVRGLELEYYDGLDWYDTWGDMTGKKQANSDIAHPNLDGMPQAVRITLSLDSEPPSKNSHEEEEIPTSDTPNTNAPSLVAPNCSLSGISRDFHFVWIKFGRLRRRGNSPNGAARQSTQLN